MSTMTNAQRMVLARARQFKFVRETSARRNRGRWVEALQRIGGTSAGQPWCACYVCAVLGLWFDDKPPIPYTASCDDILRWARANNCLHTEPAPAALFLIMTNPDDATHVGFVTEDIAKVRFGTLEGNASDPEQPPTREGWGVFERTTKHARCRKRSPNILYVYWWDAQPSASATPARTPAQPVP